MIQPIPRRISFSASHSCGAGNSIEQSRQRSVCKLLAERRIELEVTQQARELLADRGYDPHYGARPLKRVIQRMLQDPLAMKILEGEFPEGSKVSADARVSGEALEFRRAC